MSQSKANSTKPRRSCQQSPVLWPVLWLCVKISECVPTSYPHSQEVAYSCLYGVDEETKGDEVIFHCLSACIEENLGCRSQSPPSYPQWQAVPKNSGHPMSFSHLWSTCKETGLGLFADHLAGGQQSWTLPVYRLLFKAHAPLTDSPRLTTH